MSANTTSGYLVISDISGFTSYVAATELDHAQAVLSELLELIIHEFRPLLILAKLEGDAVFAHAPEGNVPRGESLLELIEATYVAFRGRVDGIVRRTTCECRACRAIPMLDLKFLVHFGHYVLQQVMGSSELIGSDVNLIHRLTKNHVAEATGWQAYALFTEASLERMGLQAGSMYALTERYEHLGEVKTYSLDLRDRYRELTEDRRVFISPEEGDYHLQMEYDAPPAVVWEWLADPTRRNVADPHIVWSALTRPGGRTGVGASNHCAHGKDGITIETVLDWRPFDYFTVKSENSGPASIMDTIDTYHLEPGADGLTTVVHLVFKCLRLRPRWLARTLAPTFFKMARVEDFFRALGEKMAEELAAGTPRVATADPAVASAEG